MKLPFTISAGAVLEHEYEVASGTRTAWWLNAAALVFIVAIIGMAIWKVERARREHRQIKERTRRLADAIKREVQDIEYSPAVWEN